MVIQITKPSKLIMGDPESIKYKMDYQKMLMSVELESRFAGRKRKILCKKPACKLPLTNIVDFDLTRRLILWVCPCGEQTVTSMGGAKEDIPF